MLLCVATIGKQFLDWISFLKIISYNESYSQLGLGAASGIVNFTENPILDSAVSICPGQYFTIVVFSN